MPKKIENTAPLNSVFPSYKNPPVNEVVCGMRFNASDKLKIPHIGVLWEKFRAEYPIIQHAPPITSAKGELLLDRETGLPLPRVWFINKLDDQLVQFQYDRFYFNWRRRRNEYPRFEYIFKNFEHVFDTISSFFLEHELGDLNPIEFELSYINHFLQGEGWNTLDDLPNIFSDFIWNHKKKKFLPALEKVAWQIHFPLPEHQGYLIVNLKQATRKDDKVPLLTLELKTIGISTSTGKEFIRDWFDIAHEWIVRGFTDLTTHNVQNLWERER